MNKIQHRIKLQENETPFKVD